MTTSFAKLGEHDMSILNHITIEELEAAVRENMFGMGNIGFCTECGAERDGCEPDAHGYECYECGANAVTGADDLYIEVA
jgi:hypothetical protein